MWNTNRKNNHTRDTGFTWFDLRPTSTGGATDKISLGKLGDYNGGTKTLPQNPSPKYTQKALWQKQLARTIFVAAMASTLSCSN